MRVLERLSAGMLIRRVHTTLRVTHQAGLAHALNVLARSCAERPDTAGAVSVRPAEETLLPGGPGGILRIICPAVPAGIDAGEKVPCVLASMVGGP